MTTLPPSLPAALPPGLPTESPAACALPAWGLIRARGEDAAGFLHGQLTQDVTSLAPGAARLAGYCSPKGRLLATFVVLRTAPDEFLLACSADLLAPTLRRLSMFVLRARCRLTDAAGELACLGVAGPAAWADAAAPGGTGALSGGTLVRLSDAEGLARALWIGPAGAEPPVPASLAPEAWAWLEVRAAVPRIVAATADAFVPQMVNLEAVGGVHFQKGCYPGQEVVARSQYRGTLKRRTVPVVLGAPAAPGDEVFDAGDPGQPAGLVVLAADWAAAGARAHVALVELKIASGEAAAAGTTTLHLRAFDGPGAAVEALPYELPPQ